MAGIGAFFYQWLNFFLGKITIFMVIFAWIFIMSGVLMVIWPERARKKLMRIGFRPLKFLLFAVAFFVITKLLSSISILRMSLIVSGLIGIICLYYSLKKMIYEKMSRALAKAPVSLLRGFALAQIGAGLLMLVFQKRIW